MSAFGEVNRQIDAAESAMRAAEQRLATVETIKAELAALIGRAEAADGLVIVEWSGGGLSALDISARAMRLPSQDLAEAIKAAVAEAQADLREQTRETLRAAGVVRDAPPSMDEVRTQLSDMREQITDRSRRSADEIDRAAALRTDRRR